MRLSDYHAKFPGGSRWRITPQGVELEDRGLLKFDARMYEIAVPFLREYATEFAAASQEYRVPVELLMACALTQSPEGPNKFVWRSPGYVGDQSTPDLISAGIFRMQLSTAQRCMKDSTLDHNWLLDVHNASRVCAAGLRFDFITLRTRWDPILTAQHAAGLPAHEARDGSRPVLRRLFARHFSAARELVDAGLLDGREFTAWPIKE